MEFKYSLMYSYLSSNFIDYIPVREGTALLWRCNKSAYHGISVVELEMFDAFTVTDKKRKGFCKVVAMKTIT